MINIGETVSSAEGEGEKLSGKRTILGRISGEHYAPKKLIFQVTRQST